MKAAMTETQLTHVSKQLASQMDQGFLKSYMGTLDHGIGKTHYWKLDFEGEDTPDMLAELTIHEGKVAGFFIR